MPRERVTLSVAGIKATILTADAQALLRIASSIDADARRKLKYVEGRADVALLLVALEQAESLRRNASVIHDQQKRVFELSVRNASLLGEADECAPVEEIENTLMSENRMLRQEIEALNEELARLRYTRCEESEAPKA